jgi:predicted HTH transcriptional regulator
MNPADFGKYSRSRNNLIAFMLMRTPYVEKMGTGILRINRELSNAGLTNAEFCFDEHNFSITFHFRNETKDRSKSSPITSDQILELSRGMS